MGEQKRVLVPEGKELEVLVNVLVNECRALNKRLDIANEHLGKIHKDLDSIDTAIKGY